MEWFSKYWGCHQLPERSFFFLGYQMPVCARCLGIIIGELFGIFSCIFLYTPSIGMCVLFMVAMIIDGGVQWRFNIMSNNRRRLITGFLAGYGIVGTIVHIIQAII